MFQDKVLKILILALASMGVLLFAGIAENGLGKRELSRDFWSDLLGTVTTTLTPLVDTAVSRNFYLI